MVKKKASPYQMSMEANLQEKSIAFQTKVEFHAESESDWSAAKSHSPYPPDL